LHLQLTPAHPVQGRLSSPYILFFSAKDLDSFKTYSEKFMSVIEDMEKVTGTSEYFLLGRCVEQAKALDIPERCWKVPAAKHLPDRTDILRCLSAYHNQLTEALPLLQGSRRSGRMMRHRRWE